MNKNKERFENVYEATGVSKPEAEKMLVKAKLMMTISEFIDANNLTQEEAARLMQVSRPRVSDVIRGQISKFTIDALIDMLARAGYHMSITAKKDKAAA
ncbi:MAG: putative helix-turn-helix domain containing protein [Gammaproteobacteria bacterium]|jgi:predicted XRE-type DNA-binding protein|nr:putative helix-turn-helix domain containing protein [Gammaproteobacteria bacterium]